MSEQKMKKIRFIPIWEEEKECLWLEDMSARGWHLTQTGYLSYYFEKGESREYTYRFDFKLSTDKDYEDYLHLFAESGWELVGVFANWHYFRIEKSAEGKELYTDTQSKKARLKRLFILMTALAAINLVIMFNNIFLFTLTDGGLKGVPVFMYFVWGILLLVVGLLAYAGVRIYLRMQKLSKSIKE